MNVFEVHVNLAGRMIVGVNIRSGEPRDVDAVLHLMRQLAEHEGLTHFFELTSEALNQACFAQPPRMELIVAETEGEIVGYATCLLQFSPWMGRDYLFLDDLYVRDKARGLGIGSHLMRHVGALALERGVDVRWHVEMENRSAQKLYRALGAELKEKLIAYWSIESIQAQIDVADPRAI
jgi:ribosomal protein S18 acetylase RimI-like enzyme